MALNITLVLCQALFDPGLFAVTPKLSAVILDVVISAATAGISPNSSKIDDTGVWKAIRTASTQESSIESFHGISPMHRFGGSP